MAYNDTARHRGLTRALGLTSLGLGVAQLAAPRRVARLAGVDDAPPPVLRAAGARELVHAAGLLAGKRHRAWAATRVVGDVADLALLGGALRRNGTRRLRVATAAVGAVTALDVYAALRARGGRGHGSMHASITVNKPAAEVYAFWRDLTHLPSFMAHLESVETLSWSRSRWTAKAPAGRTVTWEAELTDDRRNRLIAWRSLDGATVPNAGRVRFEDAPGGRGTEIHVEMTYEVPGGRAGAAVAMVFGEEPEQQVRDDLRRLKQVMETGAVLPDPVGVTA